MSEELNRLNEGNAFMRKLNFHIGDDLCVSIEKRYGTTPYKFYVIKFEVQSSLPIHLVPQKFEQYIILDDSLVDVHH